MPATLQQLTMAELVERGDLDRHLRRQRRRYGRRRDALLAQLAAQLPDLRVHGAAAGLFVLLRLPEGLDEDAVVAAARRAGVALEGAGGNRPALVIGYANLPEAGVGRAVEVLAASIRAAA